MGNPGVTTPPPAPGLAMLDLVRGLKNLVKLSHVQIDSSIFRLHYTVTGTSDSPILS